MRHDDDNDSSDNNGLLVAVLLLGIFAGTCTTLSLVPFVVNAQIYKTNTSMKFAYLQFVGQFLWLAAAACGVVSEGDGWIPLIVFAVINIALLSYYLWIRLHYDTRTTRPEGLEAWNANPFVQFFVDKTT